LVWGAKARPDPDRTEASKPDPEAREQRQDLTPKPEDLVSKGKCWRCWCGEQRQDLTPKAR
jgi:hypothetical protein